MKAKSALALVYFYEHETTSGKLGTNPLELILRKIIIQL